MTKTPNDTEIITPASETIVERRPSRKAWFIAGGGIALAVGLGAAALGVSIADAAEGGGRDDDTSQVSSVTPTQSGDDSRSDDSRHGDDSEHSDDRGGDRNDDRGSDDSSSSSSSSDDDGSGHHAPISAADRASAEAAAIAEVGSGTITDVDRSDDADHAWEVEVTFADGRDADVELDANFQVVRVDSDN